MIQPTASNSNPLPADLVDWIESHAELKGKA